MNTLNFKLPEIIFADNFSHAIINKVKKSNCIIFTSKYWAKKPYYKSLKKKINLLDSIENISPNPELNQIFDTPINLKKTNYILTIGGGSVIDFTKAVLAFNAINRKKNIYKDIVFTNKEFKDLIVPKIIAVPTTSGTGSEINSWGTVWDSGDKYSISGKNLMPTTVILDANLCKSMPTSLTVSSALDALSHSFEAIWNKNHNPIVDELSIAAIKKIKKYLPLTIKNKSNLKYRKEMQLASFLAGIAMSKTKTAICHSISYPLTSLYGLSHGIACSLTLSEVCKLNVKHNPQRASVISQAMGCSNMNLESSLIKFLMNIKYGSYLKPIKDANINNSINFINPSRSKNSLVKISNNDAVRMVIYSIKKFITN